MLMNYKLEFKASALKEWNKLGTTLKQQFKKKLKERLVNPHIPSAQLSGASHSSTKTKSFERLNQRRLISIF